MAKLPARLVVKQASMGGAAPVAESCLASALSGAWIMVGLAEDKGGDFAEMVVASDRWAFPRTSLEEARQLLALNGEHCRCARCRGGDLAPDGRALPAAAQLSLFD